MHDGSERGSSGRRRGPRRVRARDAHRGRRVRRQGRLRPRDVVAVLKRHSLYVDVLTVQAILVELLVDGVVEGESGRGTVTVRIPTPGLGEA